MKTTRTDREHLYAALHGWALKPFRGREDRYGPAPATGEAALAELDRRIRLDLEALAQLSPREN